MARYLYSVRIEGIGDQSATATNRLYRWAWSRAFLDVPATQDDQDLYKPALLRWPRELEFAVDFRRGSPALGSLSFDFRRTADVLTHFWAGVPPTIAKTSGATTAGQSTLTLNTSGLSGVVFLGREAMSLGAETSLGGGLYRYAVTRPILETSAQPHEDEVQVYATMHPTTLAGRLVQVVRTPLAGTYTDEVVRYSGVLRRVTSRPGTTTTMDVDNALALVKGTHIYYDPLRFVGGWPNQPLFLEQGGTANVGGRTPAAGADVTGTKQALLIWDDKHAVKVDWNVQSTPPLDDLLQVSNPSRWGGSPPLPEDLQGLDTREFFSTGAGAPSNLDTPTAASLPLQSDPGKLILQLLLTIANDGTGGSNHATYDTGINQLAGGIRADLVDVAAFERWGAGQIPLTQFHIGHDGPDPVNLFDLIQQILAARGASLTQTTAGLISVAEYADQVALDSTDTIVQSQIVSVDDVHTDRRLDEVLERVTIEYNDRPGIGPDIVNATDVVNERLLPRGAGNSLDIKALGLSRTADATILLQSFVGRYHDPVLEYSVRCLSTADFAPGDVVKVTHDKLIAAASVGVSAVSCLVVARRESLDDGGHTIFYRLLYVGQAFGRVGLIAPAARVVSIGGPSGDVLTVEANAYTTTTGPITSDAAGFAVNDLVQLVDQFGSVRDSSVTVSAVGSNTITVSGLGVTPVAGDVVRVVAYGSAVTSQQDDWIWIAETDGELGSDDAMEYVS